jgi:8-oxo-dGTP pyrophosphatase MutT (NUDIX family)/GNAT superfamily N-acetyltransferase
VSIRRATAADSAAAAAVVQAVYAELGFTWDAGGYHADLEDVEASYPAFFIAELDGTIVGTAGLSEHGTLERLYVLPSARGHGLGAELVRAVVEEARERGFARLEIWTDKLLTDAHRLYERLGAYRDGERVNDDPDASHEWRYVRPLSGACVAVFDGDDRVLVVRENYGRRRYSFPGGAIEAGETPAEAAIREAREETGAEIELDHLIASYGLENGFLVHLFRGRLVAGSPALQPGGELSELRWLPPELVPEPQSNVLRYGLPDAVAGRRGVVRENLARR